MAYFIPISFPSILGSFPKYNMCRNFGKTNQVFFFFKFSSRIFKESEERTRKKEREGVYEGRYAISILNSFLLSRPFSQYPSNRRIRHTIREYPCVFEVRSI